MCGRSPKFYHLDNACDPIIAVGVSHLESEGYGCESHPQLCILEPFKNFFLQCFIVRILPQSRMLRKSRQIMTIFHSFKRLTLFAPDLEEIPRQVSFIKNSGRKEPQKRFLKIRNSIILKD